MVTKTDDMSQRCIFCNQLYDVHTYYPFCSKRCSDVDLGKWVTGSYIINSEEGIEGSSEENE